MRFSFPKPVCPLTIIDSNGVIRYESASPTTIPTLNDYPKESPPIFPDEIQNHSGTEWHVATSRGKHKFPSSQTNMTIPIPVCSADNKEYPRLFTKNTLSPVVSTEVRTHEEITICTNSSTDKYVASKARNEHSTVRSVRSASSVSHYLANPRELPGDIDAFTTLINHPDLIPKIYDKVPSSKSCSRIKNPRFSCPTGISSVDNEISTLLVPNQSPTDQITNFPSDFSNSPSVSLFHSDKHSAFSKISSSCAALPTSKLSSVTETDGTNIPIDNDD